MLHSSNQTYNSIMAKISLSAFLILWTLLPHTSPLYSHAWTPPTTSSSSTTMTKSWTSRTRLRNRSTTSLIFTSNVPLPTTTTTTTTADLVSREDSHKNQELLERMSVVELKERLRSIGLKVRTTSCWTAETNFVLVPRFYKEKK